MDEDLELWIILGFVGLFFLLPFVLVMAAALWEKRLTQPYDVPEEGEQYEPLPVARQANRDAKEIGWRHGGLCHDAKAACQVRYDFWLSPDDETLGVVGSGKVLSVPVNGIWLWSRLSNGRLVCTTNEIGEQDISGAVDQQTWTGMKFKDLAAKHEPRLAGGAEPFPEESPLAGLFDIIRRKSDAMVERGYARYVDEEHTAWRHTLKGAFMMYLIGVWVRPIRRGLRAVGLVRE